MVGINNYKYAQWVITHGRSLRISPPPDGEERTNVALWLYAEISWRPWLWDRFYQKAPSLQGLVAFDNVQVAGKLVELVGRDMMKIPILHDLEATNVESLTGFTFQAGLRKFGAGGGGISPGTSS